MRARPFLLRRLALASLAAGVLAVGPGAAAQRVAPPLPDTTAARYGTSGALVFGLTEYGLSAGLSGRVRLTDDLSFTSEIGLGAGRDEREQSFTVDPLGTRVTALKRNYFLMVPIHLGLERRLFREAVEDNFRPFVHADVGPTIGYQWPYFDDLDGDGARDDGEALLGAFGGLDDGEARLGVGGTLTVGAFFGRSRRNTQALRFGLQGTYFPAEVDLLELPSEGASVEDPSRKAFWTPVVSFHVARLLGGG